MRWLQPGARPKGRLLKPDCPLPALLALHALRSDELTRPALRRPLRFLRRPGSSLLQWKTGLLACAHRAAGLQLSCCAPGSSPAQLTAVQVGRAYARPALPKVRPRPLAPHAPRLAHAHPPCRSPRHWPSFMPPSHNSYSLCAQIFAQVSIRAFEWGAVRQWGM